MTVKNVKHLIQVWKLAPYFYPYYFRWVPLEKKKTGSTAFYTFDDKYVCHQNYMIRVKYSQYCFETTSARSWEDHTKMAHTFRKASFPTRRLAEDRGAADTQHHSLSVTEHGRDLVTTWKYDSP